MAMNNIPYLGSKISLISKSEIRYEGTLYTIDTKESTVALAKVRSFGTEDRPTDKPVAPRAEVYDYIIFRGADIKDIVVCQPPRPQPTLEGGLPNDPAIVQHSAVGAVGPAASSASNIPHQNVQKPSTNFGTSAAPTAFPQPPGRRPNEISPVMDFLRGDARGNRRESGQSTQNPAQNDRRNFGAQNRNQAIPNFHRGGRGRGNFRQPRGGQQRWQQQNNGRFTRRSESSVGQPGRPGKTKETLKFDNEFDFEQANEEFKDFLSKFEKVTLDDKDDEKTEKSAKPEQEVEDGEIQDDCKILDAYYDKNKSFFDKISCEALQKSSGEKAKPDWKAQRKLNRETFGATGSFNAGRGKVQFNRGRGRGGNGGYNRNRGGGRNVNAANNFFSNKGFYSGFVNGYGRFSRENVPSAYVGRRPSTSSGYQQHQPQNWGQQRGRGNFRGQRGRQWMQGGRIF